MEFSTSNIITVVLFFVGVYVLFSKQIAVLETKIDELDKKVEKHNSVVERTFKLESDSKTAFMRIDELRADIRENRHDLDELCRQKIGGTD